MNNSMWNETSCYTQESLIKGVADVFLVGYFSVWMIKLSYDYYGQMEPIHIFLLNSLNDYLITILINFLIEFDGLFINNDYSCAILNFLTSWANLTLLIDFSAAEINRFLALYWNLLFNERVNNRRASYVVAIIKIFTFLIPLTSSVFYGSLLYCPDTQITWLRLRDSYILLLFRVVYILVTILISLYVLQVARKHQNVVVPINLDPQDNQGYQETPESNLLKLTKIGLKINLLSLVQMACTIPSLVTQILLLSSSECNQMVTVTIKILMLMNGIYILSVPILVSKKLKHFSKSL